MNAAPTMVKVKALMNFPYGSPMRDLRAGREVEVEEAHVHVLTLAGRIGPVTAAAAGTDTGASAPPLSAAATEAARLHQQALQNSRNNSQNNNSTRGRGR